MKKKIIGGFCAALLLSGTSFAQNWMSRFEYEADPEAFRKEEWQLDLFGLYATRDLDNSHEETWGVGLGGNYFFTDKLGLGLSTYVAEVDFPKHIDATFIGRYPLFEKTYLSLAPYGMVGLGRQFHDGGQWLPHLGVGMEFRMNKATGVFLDYRRVFASSSDDFDLWRFGVRLVF